MLKRIATIGIFLTIILIFSSFTRNLIPCSYQQVLYISNDCKTLIYYSIGAEAETELFYCQLNETNKWDCPQKIIFNNYAVHCLKKLGYQALDFYTCLKNGNKKRDVCKITFVGGYCCTPEFLNSSVNSKYDEANVCLSSDGTTLFFSSNRKGGLGGYDIYSCEKFDDGTWSAPRNMGKSVNSPFNEEYPFILNDQTTLFFSSNRDKGQGGYDIYSSTLSDEGLWSLAENAGNNVNSTNDEYGFFVSADESKTIVLSKNDDTLGENACFFIIANIFKEYSLTKK